MFDSLLARHMLIQDLDDVQLTEPGRQFFNEFGLDLPELEKLRRPVCRACLDWSARRSHLAGSLGSQLLSQVYKLGWAKRQDGTRIISFSPAGEAAFRNCFPV
jgi:hypothetical protein